MQVCVSVCVCVCVCLCLCLCICVSTNCMQEQECACVCACASACACACVHTCVLAYARKSKHKCVKWSPEMCLYAWEAFNFSQDSVWLLFSVLLSAPSPKWWWICVCACVRACWCRVSICACLRACMCACVLEGCSYTTFPASIKCIPFKMRPYSMCTLKDEIWRYNTRSDLTWRDVSLRVSRSRDLFRPQQFPSPVDDFFYCHLIAFLFPYLLLSLFSFSSSFPAFSFFPTLISPLVHEYWQQTRLQWNIKTAPNLWSLNHKPLAHKCGQQTRLQ